MIPHLLVWAKTVLYLIQKKHLLLCVITLLHNLPRTAPYHTSWACANTPVRNVCLFCMCVSKNLFKLSCCVLTLHHTTPLGLALSLLYVCVQKLKKKTHLFKLCCYVGMSFVLQCRFLTLCKTAMQYNLSFGVQSNSIHWTVQYSKLYTYSEVQYFLQGTTTSQYFIITIRRDITDVIITIKRWRKTDTIFDPGWELSICIAV